MTEIMLKHIEKKDAVMSIFARAQQIYESESEYMKNPINVEKEVWNEELEYGFEEKEDAIYSLFEELFYSADKPNREELYKAVRFLLWEHHMTDQYEEIKKLDETDVRV